MAVSKVDFYGNTLIDLTADTVTADTLLEGVTAHDKSGAAITGTAIGVGADAVFTEDSQSWALDSSGNIICTASFLCSKQGTAETAEDEDGGTTATCVVTVNGTEYSYETVCYAVTLANGTVKGTEKTSVLCPRAAEVKITANDPEDGQYFVGWYLDADGDSSTTDDAEIISYDKATGIYVYTDMYLVARYDTTPVEKTPVISLGLGTRTANEETGGQKLGIVINWEVPDGYTSSEAGIVRSYSTVTAVDLVLENVDGTTIRTNKTSLTTAGGTGRFNLNMSATTMLKTVSVVGYLTYTDGDGESHTIYTGMKTSAYTE